MSKLLYSMCGIGFSLFTLSFVLAACFAFVQGEEGKESQYFFGCKKLPNYECEYISKGLKAYSLAGNGTDKIEVLRTPIYLQNENGEAIEFQAKNYEAVTV